MSLRLLKTRFVVSVLGMFAITPACASSQRDIHGQVQAAAQTPNVPDDFRTHIPEPGPVSQLEAPVPEHVQLSNGLTLLVVPKRDLPLVEMAVVVKSGSGADPTATPGLASMTAELLKRGSQKRQAGQIDDEVESLGASLTAGTDEDTTLVSIGGLSGNRDELLEILSDIVLHPAFRADEIRRAKARRKTQLLEVENAPAMVARQVFRQTTFGNHPYGHIGIGTPEGLEKMQAGTIKAFYNRHFRPSNAAIIVVGDVDTNQMAGQVDALFGGWHGRAGVDAPPAKAALKARELTLVDRPGAAQSQIIVGGLGLARNTPDFFAATLYNAILGGMFHSRVNMNLREDKGWTYGAHSNISFLRSPGPQAVSAGVRTDVTGPSIGETLKELGTMRQADVTSDELQAAKNVYTLSLPGSFATVGAIASHVGDLFAYDLPLDYFRRLPTLIDAVTIADVRRVAETYFDPEHMNVVVVGDAKEVEAPLLALKRGPVMRRDVHGKKVAAQKKPAAKAKTKSHP